MMCLCSLCLRNNLNHPSKTAGSPSDFTGRRGEKSGKWEVAKQEDNNN